MLGMSMSNSIFIGQKNILWYNIGDFWYFFSNFSFFLIYFDDFWWFFLKKYENFGIFSLFLHIIFHFYWFIIIFYILRHFIPQDDTFLSFWAIVTYIILSCNGPCHSERSEEYNLSFLYPSSFHSSGWHIPPLLRGGGRRPVGFVNNTTNPPQPSLIREQIGFLLYPFIAIKLLKMNTQFYCDFVFHSHIFKLYSNEFIGASPYSHMNM